MLLGTTQYSPAVDMWSVACIFAELVRKVSSQGLRMPAAVASLSQPQAGSAGHALMYPNKEMGP